MSICFVANKELTVPYSDIARHLADRGDDIVWLSPSTRWSRWLEAEGWPKGSILNLPDFASQWKSANLERAIASLTDLESDPPATIGNVILMCRNLRWRPKSFAYRYLAASRGPVEAFLRERGVEVVFGEGTWGFELLTWLISRRLGIPMLTPLTTRIPSDRFYFADPVSGDFFSSADATAEAREWAARFLDNWRNNPMPPAYSRKIRGYKLFRRRWLKELAIGLFRSDLDRDDHTLWPLRSRLHDRARRAFNAILYKLVRPYECPSKAERYVLFCLHHQPEAAIDVYAALNSNQEALIETLSRTLPATHALWVKEHLGALGDRAPVWYRRLSRLPGVRMIDPRLDIYELIRGAALVVTISGTVGYEAALMGVPVVALAPIYFAQLLSHRVTPRIHPLDWNLRDLLASRPSEHDTRERLIDFLARLHANSFPGDAAQLGVPAARRADPRHLADEKRAFRSFIQSLRHARAGTSVTAVVRP